MMSSASDYSRQSRLTEREMQIMVCISSEGLSNPEIAARLGIAYETVKTHVSNILSKLGVERRQDLCSPTAASASAPRIFMPPAGVKTFRPWE